MSNLTFYDRQRIEFYLHFKRLSLRDIAGFIGRDVSVISREIARNKPQLFAYNAELAQTAANRKAKITNKKKLDKCDVLRQYVEEQIQNDWSPEEIAGRLKNHPSNKLKYARIKTICAETIYQHIYSQEVAPGRLYKHLRTHRSRRFKRGKRKHRLIFTPNKTSIHQRDNIINKRKRYGDMEADMLCASHGKQAISVCHERKSMFVNIHKLEHKESEEMLNAIKKTIDNLPNGFVKSFTFDNGSENAKHNILKEEFNINTYFCDTYSPWQKGSVENTNKLLRQYIPRKINMDTIDNKYLSFVQDRLNNRPRKTLNYLTPNEVMDSILKEECCTKF